MATSTLIQFLAEGSAGDTSNRRQVETFLASGTIAAGDWVQFDSAKSGADALLFVKEAATVGTKGNAAAFGVALEGAAAGEQVRAVVAASSCLANISPRSFADKAYCRLTIAPTIATSRTETAPATSARLRRTNFATR